MKGHVTIDIPIDALDKIDAETSTLLVLTDYIYATFQQKRSSRIRKYEIEKWFSKYAKIEFHEST